MAESMIVYAGVGTYGKIKKRLVAKEAKRLGYRSTADFIWDALRAAAKGDFKADLEAILTRENNGGVPSSRIQP